MLCVKIAKFKMPQSVTQQIQVKSSRLLINFAAKVAE